MQISFTCEANPVAFIHHSVLNHKLPLNKHVMMSFVDAVARKEQKLSCKNKEHEGT